MKNPALNGLREKQLIVNQINQAGYFKTNREHFLSPSIISGTGGDDGGAVSIDYESTFSKQTIAIMGRRQI